ncbi:hypothetical protein [Thermoactinomyces sp. DSM 45892]|uniref:hypothetical protein n=1 Tax=Thermoactinomyces sp. DSM 45892 TaxID=1882753 RepID=UPI000894C65D|nr:hypothetical protein [Thermoactinomyces sp. DSM 45892]SDY51415.1 hypothetical protein SAMN05444416_105131 [Thermoactinomyces sp. DSM 45892]
MPRKQWKTIIISCVVTLSVLFGAWKLSTWLTLQKPIYGVFESGENFLTVTDINVQPNVVTVQLEIIDADTFIQKYPEMNHKLQKIIGDKKLKVNWKNKPNSLTKDAWEVSRFHIQEAIAHKEYGKIPEVTEKEAQEKGIDSLSRIDEDYLYISFMDGKRFTVEMVPIQPEGKKLD